VYYANDLFENVIINSVALTSQQAAALAAGIGDSTVESGSVLVRVAVSAGGVEPSWVLRRDGNPPSLRRARVVPVPR
jgi:hypothetical protein